MCSFLYSCSPEKLIELTKEKVKDLKVGAVYKKKINVRRC